jgi:ParB family chromosome partitioning protein
MNELARPRGLGRGLSALLGEPGGADLNRPAPVLDGGAPVATLTPAWALPVAEPAPQPAPAAPSGEGGPRTIAIDLIQRNPGQPRKYFDEAELKDLSDSIRAHGVLQPILVRPVKTAPGRYEIIAGERRWRASQMAGLHQIPALVREAVDEVETLEIAIIENVQRSDLNPLEEAAGYQQLMEKFGRTQQDIADVVGKSRPHIANMLRLLQLPDEIQDMVKDGRLSAGHARAILTAPDPLALAKQAIANGLNVRDIEKMAAQMREPRESRGPTKPEKDADTRALEAQIANALGLPVLITAKPDGSGEVRITYKRLEQLDEIVRRLGQG